MVSAVGKETNTGNTNIFKGSVKKKKPKNEARKEQSVNTRSTEKQIRKEGKPTVSSAAVKTEKESKGPGN